MSTMRANTIANVAGTGSPDIVGGELCRARYLLTGTGTIAIADSFNISSAVDNGTGDYTFNFSTVFPNAFASSAFGADVGQTRISTLTASSLRTVSFSTGTTTQADCVTGAILVGDKP